MNRFLIIKINNLFEFDIFAYFKTFKEAENKINDLKKKYDYSIVNEGDDGFTIETDYGNLENFQIVELDEHICKK